MVGIGGNIGVTQEHFECLLTYHGVGQRPGQWIALHQINSLALFEAPAKKGVDDRQAVLGTIVQFLSAIDGFFAQVSLVLIYPAYVSERRGNRCCIPRDFEKVKQTSSCSP